MRCADCWFCEMVNGFPTCICGESADAPCEVEEVEEDYSDTYDYE